MHTLILILTLLSPALAEDFSAIPYFPPDGGLQIDSTKFEHDQFTRHRADDCQTLVFESDVAWFLQLDSGAIRWLGEHYRHLNYHVQYNDSIAYNDLISEALLESADQNVTLALSLTVRALEFRGNNRVITNDRREFFTNICESSGRQALKSHLLIKGDIIALQQRIDSTFPSQ